jgi:hypothetical protein
MTLLSLLSFHTLKSSAIVFAFLFASGTVAIAWQGHDDNPDYPYIPIDHKTIQYEETPTTDVVGRFAEAVEKGEKNLAWNPKFGYLPSLRKYSSNGTDPRFEGLGDGSSGGAVIRPGLSGEHGRQRNVGRHLILIHRYRPELSDITSPLLQRFRPHAHPACQLRLGDPFFSRSPRNL